MSDSYTNKLGYVTAAQFQDLIWEIKTAAKLTAQIELAKLAEMRAARWNSYMSRNPDTEAIAQNNIYARTADRLSAALLNDTTKNPTEETP